VGEKTGPNPTDRSKSGTKRSVLTEGRGVPLAVIVAGANEPDMILLAETLGAVVVARPEPTPEAPQNLCADKGYEYLISGTVEAVSCGGYIMESGRAEAH